MYTDNNQQLVCVPPLISFSFPLTESIFHAVFSTRQQIYSSDYYHLSAATNNVWEYVGMRFRGKSVQPSLTL